LGLVFVITLVAVVMVILTLNVRVNKNFVDMQILEFPVCQQLFRICLPHREMPQQ